MIKKTSAPLSVRPLNALNTSLPYKKLVVSFLVAAAAITLLVLYYSLGQATINLSIKPDSSIMEGVITVGTADKVDASGVIKQLEYKGEQTFPASPSGEREAKASGKVSFINKSNQGQTLIATTRLLSKDGVLYRLVNTVNVPANGTLVTDAIADQAGDSGLIPPTTFIIPGLRANLQDKIYAESTQPMERAEKPGHKVTALDFERARKALSDQLLPPALAKIRDQLTDQQRKMSVVYNATVSSEESDAPADTNKDKFQYSVTLKVTAVFYDQSDLKDKMLAKLQTNRTDGKKILTIEDQSLSLNVNEFSIDLAQAQIGVKFLAQVAITDASKAFNKNDLLGRTIKEVQNYFSTIPGVVKAEVKLWPFWVTAVPSNPNSVELMITQN